MPTKLDAKAAAAAVQEKQTLEVNLAWELLGDVYNNKGNGLIVSLRECADLVLQEMVAIRDGCGKDGVAGVQAALDDEKDKQALLKKHRDKVKIDDGHGGTKTITALPAAKLNTLLKDVEKWDAQDVSDLIRLYGCFVEFAAKNATLKKFYESVFDKKEGFRKGTEKIDPNAVWNQGVDMKDKKTVMDSGRHRQNLMNDKYKEAVAKWEKEKLPPNKILDETVKLLAELGHVLETSSRGNVQNFLVSMEGGQKIFALKDTSTLGRIDKAFGLVPSSDISGTTADSMFFFNKFPGIDPIFQVLPLATIVAGAHHSMIEVAIPLSQNKFVDYTIGFYTTLFPSKTKHGAAGALQKALKLAENEKLNHHLLVWYTKDGKAIEGAYEFKAGEKQLEAYKKFAHATDALTYFSKVKEGWLTATTIEEIMTKNGLK